MQMLVFRDDAGRETLCGAQLKSGLRAAFDRKDALDALLRAGEIESALADIEDHRFDPITDLLARILVNGEGTGFTEAAARLDQTELPSELHVVAPEGFSFYGLHPLDYLLTASGAPAAVIGIRSIGTTLSAIAAASLACPRITVRPTGHPYDRKLHLSSSGKNWVQQQAQKNAEFFVVDEGPGLSGTSFLAVADALTDAGVDPEQIRLVGSRSVDAEKLVGRDATRRWSRYRFSSIQSATRLPENALALDDWREWVYAEQMEWPAVWTAMSTAKGISRDGDWFFKCEGLGRYGARTRSRSDAVYAAGFGPELQAVGNGFTGYRVIMGGIPTLGSMTIQSIANYIAWRGDAFAALPGDIRALEQMARFNHQQLWEAELPADFRLEIERPTVVDGRMMPHEWRIDHRGKLVKLDAANHGDNHFFPGTTDIAWDVAGAITEWQMDRGAEDEFVRAYRHASGDHITPRLGNYLIAYRAFQAGYAKMAAVAMAGSVEQSRLLADVDRYAMRHEIAAEFRAS